MPPVMVDPNKLTLRAATELGSLILRVHQLEEEKAVLLAALDEAATKLAAREAP